MQPIKRSKKFVIYLLFGFYLISFSLGQIQAAPQDLSEQMEQRDSAKRAAEESQKRRQQEVVRLEKKSRSLEKIELPQEENTFFIEKIILEGEDAEKFPWAQKYLQQYNEKNIGLEGINLLVRELNEALTDKGFVTSRIYLRKQDVSSGILKLTIMAGKVQTIRFKEETWGTWKNAFPISSGKILNIRDIEQGLEQMRRLPSQDADIDIEPAEKPGQSDIVISVKREKPWRLSISADDSGTKETGKYQMTTALSIDNILGLNDMLTVSYNTDAMRKGERKGTRADSIYYSIPSGRFTFSISRSKNNYHQSIDTAILPVKYTGNSVYTQFTTNYLVHRNQKSKTDLEFGVIHKNRRAYIDTSEITVQRQNTTAVRLGVLHKKYIGAKIFDAAVRYQHGIKGLGAKPGVTDNNPNGATTQYGMFLFDLNLHTPFQLAEVKGRYNVNLRGQFTRNNLYGSEFFNIAGRYTVRGFDGEQNLSAEKGLLLRQELIFPVLKNKHQIYAALDYGRVCGRSAEYLLGQSILGTALGMRGSVKNLQYDVFIGWPLKKPDGFQTEKKTLGFYLTSQF